MSLKKKAAQVRAKGSRNVGEDSVLAHISPKEAMLLKLRGGSGQPDPNTGLPHFNENGDGGEGGSMGAGGWGGGWGGDSGGWSGGLDGAPDTGTIGGGLQGGNFGGDEGGYDSGGGEGAGSPGYGDLNLDSAWGGFDSGFNAAQDSQAANEALGLSADSSFSGDVSIGTPDSISNFLDSKKLKGLIRDSAINKGLSALGVPGLAIGLGRAATASGPAAQAAGFGSTALGGIGTAFGGPFGGWIGSALGSALGGFEAGRSDQGRAEAGAGMNATNAGMSSGSGAMDIGGILTGLAGLYQGNKASDVTTTAVNNNNTAGQFAQQQAQTLADMYGPNSPYAQQLRQGLERKDAAAGRRSQYGPREVELQARLAEMQSRNAPNILNANKQYMDANKQGVEYKQAGNKTSGQNLAGLISLANKTGLTGAAQKGLSGLWNGIGSGSAGSGSQADLGSFTPGTGYSNAPAPSGNGDSGGNFWDNWEF